ncbi:MAG: hypothetical protein ACK5PS_16200 [Desulfopila sp.]
MLKLLSYLGGKIITRATTSKAEWQMVYQALKQTTNLDPRFFDPYVVAEMTLPSEAGMVQETNTLLAQGAEVLTDNYQPHFFLWYNYTTYLNDPASAAKHMKKAAQIPGAPAFFTTLAARTDLYAGEFGAAASYLEETLKKTTDPALRQFFTKRLEAVKRIGFLEYKIKEYRKRFDKEPQHLQDLIDSGIVTRIPSDPYGGKFYIMDNGRVYTTSKLVARKSGA